MIEQYKGYHNGNNSVKVSVILALRALLIEQCKVYHNLQGIEVGVILVFPALVTEQYKGHHAVQRWKWVLLLACLTLIIEQHNEKVMSRVISSVKLKCN